MQSHASVATMGGECTSKAYAILCSVDKKLVHIQARLCGLE